METRTSTDYYKASMGNIEKVYFSAYQHEFNSSTAYSQTKKTTINIYRNIYMKLAKPHQRERNLAP